VHRLTTVNGTTRYTYDADGNAISRTRFDTLQAVTLGYDYENRLTTISGGASATYVYDGDGKLVKKNSDALIGNYYEYLSGGTVKK
jgi:YD repeat-containing protein